jgi:molybdate transport system substrate-binding protein
VRILIGGVLAAALGLSCSLATAADHRREPIVVFAAASLTDALNDIRAAFTKETGIEINPSYAASSVLARQIEAGAPAEIFMSADEEWMDYLERKQQLAPGSRRDLLANELVLIAPADSVAKVEITDGKALLAAIGDARVATGDPDSVPVGKYAKAALMKLGVWNRIESRLVRAENVRAALAYVARGEAPFGIVYLTDAKIEKQVKRLDTFPASSHPPIRYPIALTTQGAARAQRFVKYLSGKSAAATFEKYGFSRAP